MKLLQDYSEEIYKCSRCGMCQAVCPVFQETGIETTVSRGKFTLLNGVINGIIKPGKNFSKYIDLCTGCEKCYEFCPSGISAGEMMISARHYNNKLNGMSFLKKFIITNFDSNLKLFALKILLSLYRDSGMINLTDFAASLLKDKGNIISLFNYQLKVPVKYKKIKPAKQKSSLKISYFPGCINNYINSGAKNAAFIVLEKNGFEITIPDGLSCCGIPARSAGDLDRFIKIAKKNLDKIDPDIDYLITDCASCGAVWKLYEDILDGEYKEKASIIAKKSININKFLIQNDLYIPDNPDNIEINKFLSSLTNLSEYEADSLSITYHDPCHLKRGQEVYIEPREILRLIPGLDYREMKESDKCCGASGTFCINNPSISRAISKSKAQNIINADVQIVSTSCPSCKIGISQGLYELNTHLPVYQPVELLAKLYLSENVFTYYGSDSLV